MDSVFKINAAVMSKSDFVGLITLTQHNEAAALLICCANGVGVSSQRSTKTWSTSEVVQMADLTCCCEMTQNSFILYKCTPTLFSTRCL